MVEKSFFFPLLICVFGCVSLSQSCLKPVRPKEAGFFPTRCISHRNGFFFSPIAIWRERSGESLKFESLFFFLVTFPWKSFNWGENLGNWGAIGAIYLSLSLSLSILSPTWFLTKAFWCTTFLPQLRTSAFLISLLNFHSLQRPWIDDDDGQGGEPLFFPLFFYLPKAGGREEGILL